MIEIAAAVVGVILAAVITYVRTAYRSLITYEITRISQELAVNEGAIVPFEGSAQPYSTRICAYSVRFVNRGWKNIADVRMHAEGDYRPFSIAKSATTISPETITAGQRGNSLEFMIEFLPAKEEVTVSFSVLKDVGTIHRVTGAGSSFKVESAYYYCLRQQSESILKSFFAYIGFGLFVALVVNFILAPTALNDRPAPPKTAASAPPPLK